MAELTDHLLQFLFEAQRVGTPTYYVYVEEVRYKEQELFDAAGRMNSHAWVHALSTWLVDGNLEAFDWMRMRPGEEHPPVAEGTFSDYHVHSSGPLASPALGQAPPPGRAGSHPTPGHKETSSLCSSSLCTSGQQMWTSHPQESQVALNAMVNGILALGPLSVFCRHSLCHGNLIITIRGLLQAGISTFGLLQRQWDWLFSKTGALGAV